MNPILFRIDKSKYIKKMYDEGELSFGCAKIWSEDTHNDRGDEEEGLISRLPRELSKEQTFFFKKIKSKYKKDLLITEGYDCCNVKIKSSMYYPIMCFYRFDDRNFDLETLETGKQINGLVDKDYLESFGSNEASILIIHNVELFLKKICISLKEKYDIEYKDIIYKEVTYFDKTKVYFSLENPDQLFVKDIRYETQKENRIVIVKNKLIRKGIENNRFNLRIGSMKNYSALINYSKEIDVIARGDINVERIRNEL